ncbi:MULTISPECIES: hypothetical protein [unclassified Polaribacter]|nr:MULTISPECIES: hypothetical protein [unclassified Polaribacter]
MNRQLEKLRMQKKEQEYSNILEVITWVIVTLLIVYVITLLSYVDRLY